jgi:hypothetical protein
MGPAKAFGGLMHKTVFAAVGLFALAFATASAPAIAAGAPEPVRIEGFSDEAMEPFISRDGRYLFWNSRNDPGANTTIHYAENDRGVFVYRGILLGTTSYDLDATPTMAGDGRFCFVSTREYRRALLTVFCGAFDGKRVVSPTAQASLPGQRLGRIIFDVEYAADGKSLIFAEGTFSGDAVPDDADLFMATVGTRGFERSQYSPAIFGNVNTDDLEYAPALSEDGLTLYFTRVTGFWMFRKPHLFRATRASLDEPFGKPQQMKELEGFVEGPSLAADGTLYFHKKIDGRFSLWRQLP